MIKSMFFSLASTVAIGLLCFCLDAKADGPDFGSAPDPYPEATAFSQEYESTLHYDYLGDDCHIDDGVTFDKHPSLWLEGDTVTVIWTITRRKDASFYPRGNYFRLWIDWNHDGDWGDKDELVVDVHRLTEGLQSDSFVVPHNAHGNHGNSIWARAWLSYGYPAPIKGDMSTSFGEIEDYELISPRVAIMIDQAWTADFNGQFMVELMPGDNVIINDSYTVIDKNNGQYGVKRIYTLIDHDKHRFPLGKQKARRGPGHHIFMFNEATIPADTAHGKARIRIDVQLRKSGEVLDKKSRIIPIYIK